MAVSACNNFSLVVAEDGNLFAFGKNDKGQLVGETPVLTTHCIPRASYGNVPALMVACGSNFTMLLTATGRVWTCGFGGRGQLGTGLSQHDCSSYVLELVDTDDFRNAPVTFISAGGNHAMVLQEGDGSLWAWGSNL